jgi:hypothetical protein
MTIYRSIFGFIKIYYYQYNKKLTTVFFWVIRQRVALLSYRRFGTNNWSTFQKSRMQKRKGRKSKNKGSLIGLIGCPETSVRNFRYSLRNNPEVRNSYQLRGESLKSRNELVNESFQAFQSVQKVIFVSALQSFFKTPRSCPDIITGHILKQDRHF